MVSIYVIGSQARNVTDCLSDKDLLAVGSPEKVDAATSIYVDEGWNVARYTYSAFSAMADSRSLFVQHVKQDGKMIRDDDLRLSRALRGFCPKEDYFPELLASVEPIRDMREVEQSYWGKLFQADVLYVSIRNSCIFHRASVAEPEFDYKELISWICGKLGLDAFQQDTLLQLRSLKHAYRARSETANASVVDAALPIAKRIGDHWVGCAGESVRSADCSNGYFEVRALEGQLVRAIDPIYLDRLNRDHELSAFWSIVCNSDPYRPRPPHLAVWSRAVAKFLSDPHSS